MSWTDEQWAMFCAILRRGFASRDPFDSQDAAAYRVLLDDLDPEAVMRAVKAMVFDGQALRPSPGEIVARIRADAGQPTFEEAYRLIFGPDGVLTARPTATRWSNEAERRRLVNEAAIDRAARLHPLIGSFIARQGLDRLRELPVDDRDYGELRRKELREAWDRHVEACDGREVAALAAGDGSPKGLKQFDPFAALEAVGALTEGDGHE